MRDSRVVLTGFLIGLGLVLGGVFIGKGFVDSRRVQRTVTMKGLAEREVSANLALWPLRFVSTNNDLDRAQAGIERSQRAIMAFLARNGIDSTQVELQDLEVTDILANPYRSGPADSRFIISQTLMVRSEDALQIQAASQRIDELVKAGVVLSSEGGPGGSGPTYLFTRLNDLKPAMIAEATANARLAAQQFAQDSGSRLGKIRSASQGVFVILPRDQVPGIMEEKQLRKIVRVVSTLEYDLVD